MQDEDRVKLFNWNVACIVLTLLPFAYMHSVSYRSSDDTEQILRALDPTRQAIVRYTDMFRA
jgi:hypothetical protein